MGKKENKIEQPVCDYAKRRGLEVRKVKYIAHDGAPDRMFYGFGQLFFIEFKAPDGSLSVEQKREIKTLQHHSIKVFVVDNVNIGKDIIDGAVIIGKRQHAEAAISSIPTLC